MSLRFHITTAILIEAKTSPSSKIDKNLFKKEICKLILNISGSGLFKW